MSRKNIEQDYVDALKANKKLPKTPFNRQVRAGLLLNLKQVRAMKRVARVVGHA